MAGKAFLKKENVQKLIEGLRTKYEVYAPVRKAGTKWHAFSSTGMAELDYSTTINPPKKVFFPPFETMFGISDGKLVEAKSRATESALNACGHSTFLPSGRACRLRFARTQESLGRRTAETTWAYWRGPAVKREDKPTLLFGVHLHDVAALLILDKVFAGEKFKDPYYIRKRMGSVIVALKNGEGPDSFQRDFGIDWAALGGWDVLLEEADGGYVATAGTAIGGKIISDGRFFSEVNGGIRPKPLNGKPVSKLDLKKIASAITPDKPIWKDIAGRCFGCGNCCYACPICHCFEVEDRLDVTGGGKRQRRWDSCYLPDFARVSGGRTNAGHNFRPDLANRTFYWYHHKFVRAPLERGTVDCIGCGRCITFCPAKIQIREELGKLQEKGGD